MRKIPTLFVRDRTTRHVTDQVTPGCEWVLAGEGIATRKYDGTCMMLDENGEWWSRREVKPGKQPPPNYIPIETDQATGKTVGWEPVEQSPFAKHWQEAPVAKYARMLRACQATGTYEFVGPKINGNPERTTIHRLERHEAAEVWADFPRDPDGIRELLTDPEFDWEGIVWHHPDGRMAKIKVRDYRHGRRGRSMSDFDLNAFAQEVHANAVAKGFWPDGGRPWGETIALIHAELSEALEAHRAGRPRLWWEQYLNWEHGYAIIEGLPPGEEKPEGWAVELADAVLRCLDAIAQAGVESDWVTRRGTMAPDDFPSQISMLHSGVTDAHDRGDERRLCMTVLDCLDMIGGDWPEILQAKHAYNVGRPHMHGKAY